MTAHARREDVPEGLASALRREPWARELGVEYLELAPGHCRVALTLRPEMLNHQGTPHGGVIFSLADVAFGAACNARGGGTWVALSMTIRFLSAAPPGSRLVAEARERRHGRRAAFYDVLVSTHPGVPVAAVHCVAHRIDSP